MLTFSDYLARLDLDKLLTKTNKTTTDEVAKSLHKSRFNLDDFFKFISPAAIPFLEEMAQKAHQLTVQRFGKVMQLYAPLYLANFCENSCIYCGYNAQNKLHRYKLSPAEITAEAQALKAKGFEHILLLTGEAPQAAGHEYLAAAIKQLRPDFASIALEVYPMSTEAYCELINCGADSLTIYQETYHPETYAKVHLSGNKRDYLYRLNTPDRAGQAHFYRLNLGALLGLYDWRYEALALAHHLIYLQKTYWQTKLSVSLPRIRPVDQSYLPPYLVTDLDVAQFVCAFRLVFPDIGITLSTRESAQLRDNLLPLGITSISAESNTSPGGYAGKKEAAQFPITDKRSLTEIKQLLIQKGYDPVFKDWDRSVIS